MIFLHASSLFHTKSINFDLITSFSDCSAGVGRTGTFIALCNLLQEAEATGKMDFLSALWNLRQDRMHTIQTVVRDKINRFII